MKRDSNWVRDLSRLGAIKKHLSAVEGSKEGGSEVVSSFFRYQSLSPSYSPKNLAVSALNALAYKFIKGVELSALSQPIGLKFRNGKTGGFKFLQYTLWCVEHYACVYIFFNRGDSLYITSIDSNKHYVPSVHEINLERFFKNCKIRISFRLIDKLSTLSMAMDIVNESVLSRCTYTNIEVRSSLSDDEVQKFFIKLDTIPSRNVYELASKYYHVIRSPCCHEYKLMTPLEWKTISIESSKVVSSYVCGKGTTPYIVRINRGRFDEIYKSLKVECLVDLILSYVDGAYLAATERGMHIKEAARKKMKIDEEIDSRKQKCDWKILRLVLFFLTQNLLYFFSCG